MQTGVNYIQTERLLKHLTARIPVFSVCEVASTFIDLQGALTRTFTLILLHSVAVKAEAVHSATSTERQGVTGFIDNTRKSIGPWDPCKTIFGAMASVDQISEVTHNTRVELIETLHSAVTEAIAQIFLDKVWVIQNIIGN